MMPEPRVPESRSKLTRLYWAMGAYAAIALLAWTTLDGLFRYGVDPPRRAGRQDADRL